MNKKWKKHAWPIYTIAVLTMILLATILKIAGFDFARTILISPSFLFFMLLREHSEIMDKVWNFPRDTTLHTFILSCFYFPIIMLPLPIGLKTLKIRWLIFQILLLAGLSTWGIWKILSLLADFPVPD